MYWLVNPVNPLIMRIKVQTVVVIVSDTKPEQRDWIITAYITRKLSDGEMEWEKR